MVTGTGIEKNNDHSGSPESRGKSREGFTVDGRATGQWPARGDHIYDLLDVVEESHQGIFELTDIIEDSNSLPEAASLGNIPMPDAGQPENFLKTKEIKNELEGLPSGEIGTQPRHLSQDEIMKNVLCTVERIAREMIPEIVERIVREEIEQLKKELEEEVH